jgi:hypothetical protein
MRANVDETLESFDPELSGDAAMAIGRAAILRIRDGRPGAIFRLQAVRPLMNAVIAAMARDPHLPRELAVSRWLGKNPAFRALDAHARGDGLWLLGRWPDVRPTVEASPMSSLRRLRTRAAKVLGVSRCDGTTKAVAGRLARKTNPAVQPRNRPVPQGVPCTAEASKLVNDLSKEQRETLLKLLVEAK